MRLSVGSGEIGIDENSNDLFGRDKQDLQDGM